MLFASIGCRCLCMVHKLYAGTVDTLDECNFRNTPDIALRWFSLFGYRPCLLHAQTFVGKWQVLPCHLVKNSFSVPFVIFFLLADRGFVFLIKMFVWSESTQWIGYLLYVKHFKRPTFIDIMITSSLILLTHVFPFCLFSHC